MSAGVTVPHLTLLRVLTAGGPYAVGQLLSLAFLDASVGRLGAHEASGAVAAVAGPFPESISVTVVAPAEAFATGDLLTLSFVDPAFVRIHRPPISPEATPQMLPRPVATSAGVAVRATWSSQEAQRFVAVVDKLFTVDRLGWYRHALAMRMLLPDTIALADVSAGGEAARHLDALRSAATEALGAPLLAALIPQFAIDAEWLESIESPALIKALAALREAIEPFVTTGDSDPPAPEDASALTGTIRSGDYEAVRSGGADAFLPLLIPSRARHDVLSLRLGEYRTALLELFGQTARTSGSVRLKQMALPNHVLDDRLWNLAGAVQDAFADRAVA